jgi:hypothetical protein
MVFAITGVHGGHALAIKGAHGALYATSHYQAGAKQQGSKSHRGVSHEFPVHVCFLRHSCVVFASPSLSGGGSFWRCLRYAAYAHGLKQALCHRLAEVRHFFVMVRAGTLTCLIFDT